MRVLTYSRNVFIPVTDLCSNRCGYCSFRRDPDRARIIRRSEASRLISQGSEAGCSEALLCMGDSPWKVPGFDRIMASSGLAGISRSDFIDYLIELCEMSLAAGLLPHTNAGLLSEDEMKRIAPYNASMGLMLETTADVSAHAQSPDKNPARRISHIAQAGRLKIPFTTGILIGIGESRTDRLTSLKAISKLHKDYGHIQEVIVQPLNPKPGTSMSTSQPPMASEVEDTVRLAKKILPGEVAIQVPPNLIEPRLLVEAGADDLGGISPVTPDWINPERPWPELEGLHLKGYCLRERLPVYPRYILRGWYGNKTKRLVNALAGHDGLRCRTELKVINDGKEAS
ncbi:MAG: 7,8-didemethyl-8-hydroxy-5-deazariboflavin synthase subunit CofG [Methanotrichaceae archaeon]